MELTLQSISPRCQVTGREFAEGDRVASFLVRGATPGPAPEKPDPEAIGRFDVAEEAAREFAAPGPVVCRWVQIFKPRKAGADNPERNLKLTAESLFLTLTDPANERTVETERLLQVLAMMLERKRVLRPKGRTGRGETARQVYEHAKLKSLHEVQAAELSPEFFMSIQEQLAALVGGVSGGGGPGAVGSASAKAVAGDSAKAADAGEAAGEPATGPAA